MDTPQKERIGDYELVGLIGDGAQGRVYKARFAPDPNAPSDSRTTISEALQPGDLVALKVVRITGEDEKLRLKFQEQAYILRRLTHTSIVAYRDCFSWHAGEWDESQCLVMELLEGESLQDRLKKASSGLPWPQVEEIFEQCLAGLIHARERGITHRDIKPSNIFLTVTGQAKLIDFDIARRDDSGQMSTAGFKGTFDYMAPDFITTPGFRGDEVSDIFSLGVCFYQALTGSLPFEALGETAHIGYLNRWRDNANPAPSFRPGVFRVLSNAKAVVARCLSARRDQRYPTFAALLEDFRKIRYRRIRHKNKEEYELLSVLGRGGFGEVFKARRVSDGLLVAVKYLFSEKQSDRFIREAKILQQYSHPNLVKYVDFMVLEGATGEKQFFLVMEFLEGMPGWTLRPRLKNEGKLEVSEAVPLFSAYLSALQFLHENPKPIIHRDIKPGNLYAPVGQPEKGKIFDLGVARDVTGTVTVGGVPGTLDYMAPEFAEAGGDRGSPQSDLYALGLCLYEALAGKPVFGRLPTDLNSAWVAFQDRIRTPPSVTFDADAFVQFPRLKQVILTALAPAPSNRYGSAADMRAELQAALRPMALETHASAGFDALDVTMATSPADLPNPPAPADAAVTLGTRPLAPADLPAAVAALRPAAGDRRPGPERRPAAAGRRLPLIGSLAAAAVLLGLGGLWLMRRGSGQDPASAQATRPAEPAADLLAVPSGTRPADAGAATKPADEPRPPATAKPARPAEERPPAAAAVSRPQAQDVAPEDDPLFKALRDSLPTRVDNPAEWSACELALARLQAQENQPWPGLDATEISHRLGLLRRLLASRAVTYLERNRDAALALYADNKDGAAERERLVQLFSETPQLKALLNPPYTEALERIDAARTAYAVRTTLADLPARIAKTESAEQLHTLVAAFLKLETTPGVSLTPEQIGAVEQAFTARFLALAQSLAKKAEAAYAADRPAEGDPAYQGLAALAGAVAPRFGQTALAALEQAAAAARKASETRAAETAARARAVSDAAGRLDTLLAALTTGTAGAPAAVLQTLSSSIKGLAAFAPEQLADPAVKTKWETARDTCSARLEQLLEQTEPVEARPERLKAVGGCLAIPEADPVLGSRAETLRKAHTRQLALCLLRLTNETGAPVTVSSAEFRRTPLAPGEVKEWFLPVAGETATLSIAVDMGDRNRSRIETLKLQRAGGLERVIGETGAGLVRSAAAPVAPVTAAPPQPAASAPAAGVPADPAGFFEITVAPKTAAVLVDGNPAAAGRVEVTSGENHKVSASLKGYKPVEQYYKVKAGETRKIDLLLEKEKSRSLFGF